jgi:salicylate hydroxylase
VAREIGAGAAVFARKRAWRTIIPFADLPAWMRAPVTTLWLGPNAHVVHYPLRGRDAVNFVLVTDDRDAAEGWSAPGDPRAVAGALRGWAAEIRGVVAAEREWRGWPLYHGPPGRPLVQGRIALLGDAAHPMLPFLAQGAALAIEDAAELAVWLDRARGAVGTRLLGYAETRRARTHRIQQESWRNGERYHWRWPRSALRDGALRLAGGDALLGRYDWIYGWRPSSPPLPLPRRLREAS